MVNDWATHLEKIQVILFDYPAMFETGRYPVFDSLLDTILDLRIKVILSSSFDVYNLCVRNEARNPAELLVLKQTDTFLAKLSDAGLLAPERYEMSMFSALLPYTAHKDTCLITGKHASVLNLIRVSEISGDISVCVCARDKFIFYPDLSTCMQGEVPREVNAISSSIDYLDVAIYVNVGDTVYTDTGAPVLLARKVSTGAEGIVFFTDDPKVVAKIYHRGIMTPLRWMKLTRMTKMGVNAKGICWPSSLLYNNNHEPVGYLMPAAQGHTLGSAFDGQDAMSERFPDWDRHAVVQAACQVFSKIVFLHLFGILIGDIQLKNIMVNGPSQVYLIDMDSVQIEDLPCPVGTEEFTPPELWDRSFQTFLRNSLHEDYSCGILSFAMLFCGQHPYNQCLGQETLRDEIASRAFPYKMDDIGDSTIPVGGYDKIWQAIPYQLRQMFVSAFSGGKRYETIEWYAALASYRHMLDTRAFTDPQAYMVFPYTHRKAAEDSACNSGHKKSIRDAIIHVPEKTDENDKKPPEKVIYNGRPIGVAFVNQELLTENDIQKIKSQYSHASYSGRGADRTVSDKAVPACPASLGSSAKASVKSSNIRGKAGKSTTKMPTAATTILLIIIFILVVVCAVFFNVYKY